MSWRTPHPLCGMYAANAIGVRIASATPPITVRDGGPMRISAPYSVGARRKLLSPLHTRPAHTPFDASAPPSRDTPHDAEPAWIAIPSPYDSSIHFAMPV